MAIMKVSNSSTIDVVLVTFRQGDTEIAVVTSSKVGAESNLETEEAKTNIINGVLIAQKRGKSTLTGTTLTLTDNTFSADVVKMVQGGTIIYDADGVTITGYRPPKAGEIADLTPFEACFYTSEYDESGLITRYEKMTYPNCTSDPVAFSSEYNNFRTMEYKITSAAASGEYPYQLDYVDELPIVSGVSDHKITSFSLGVEDEVVVINETNHTIAVTVPSGTTLTSITPVIEFYGALISPTGAQNFTSTVTYTVTAYDTTTQAYTVTVTEAT